VKDYVVQSHGWVQAGMIGVFRLRASAPS